MALAKERTISHEPFMMSSVDNLSPESPYSPEEFEKPANGISDDGQSVINFSSFLSNSSDQSLLSFDPKEEYYSNTNSDQSYNQWNSQSSRLVSADFSCSFQTSSDYSSISNCTNQNGWLYSESTVTIDHSFEESETQESGGFKKRPNTGESGQDAKKQCTSTNSNAKKTKVQKPITPSKDPQSIAAKNRRERISERLKVLQELVPNGSKVDLVTMLEKAIGYVKFLQLQVKVLATDEFWPVQGSKAPDISQVREAIDAILSSSSQKDRSSSSK